jgi:hypothetical protein
VGRAERRVPAGMSREQATSIYTNIFKKRVEPKYDGMVATEFRCTGGSVAELRAVREMVSCAA